MAIAIILRVTEITKIHAAVVVTNLILLIIYIGIYAMKLGGISHQMLQ